MRLLNIRIQFLALFCIIIVLSCSKDEHTESIDAELVEYFERFKVAGAERGVLIDFEELQIEGHIEQINDAGVAGKCVKYTNGERVILIDEHIWFKYHEFEREFLLFHELGHCALNRGHLNIADDDGYCISLMASNDLICTNNYWAGTREKYLDELFK